LGNLYKPIDEGLRAASEYSEARSFPEEKRKAMARVVEIDRALRDLCGEDPAKVEVARGEIPSRRPQGRPRLGKQ